MARRRRITLPNVPMHVIQRGNNKQVCFFQTVDYAVYLNKLKESATKYDVKVHCFVLMTNHVHLLLTASCHSGISLLMQSLGRYYVRYINTTYSRTGTLWEGRYKSSVVDSENYLLSLYQYIELNPVRAKMVAHPRDYPWSSYHMNGGNRQIGLISQHPLYLALGDSVESRRHSYNGLLKQTLSDDKVAWISSSTNKSRVLGSKKFTQQISTQLEHYAGYLKHGGDRRSKDYMSTANLSYDESYSEDD